MATKATIAKRFVKVYGKKYTMKDMADWFVQIRGFPTILVFGTGRNRVMGEGQSGGRMVTELAKRVERKMIDKYGEEKYIEGMDILLGKK